MSIPRWPLHPIGILVLNTFSGVVAWPSLFLGWLIKVLMSSRSSVPVLGTLLAG
jgi:hypothetical protein